jgi:putative membrane protein
LPPPGVAFTRGLPTAQVTAGITLPKTLFCFYRIEMQNNRRYFYFTLFFKGVAMGAANVIPGVSGGTIALIAGVFERLINAIKSINGHALRLLFSGRFRELAGHVDLTFLVVLFAGVGSAIISLAKVLKFLFEFYPIHVWSFFLGLVLASIFFVGQTIKKWSFGTVVSLLAGTATAAAISVLTPASENSAFFYLVLCGAVGVCSMILPGLSGSFVLVLMGNYQLVMINAVSDFDMAVLLPVAVGVVVGLIAFSHFLSWVLRKFPDQTIAILTGFITGSLGILWPWKTAITRPFGEKIKTIGYAWHLPHLDTTFVIAVLFMVLGIASIVLTEMLAGRKTAS